MKRLISILALAALPLYANEPQTESVRGTVLYCQPWQFFLLKTEDRVVRVQTKQGAPSACRRGRDIRSFRQAT